MRSRPLLPFVALAVAAIVAFPGLADASHDWNGFHWARKTSSFTLKVGDNVSSSWDSKLNTAISDWSKSSKLDLTKVTGRTRPKPCKPTLGRIEACSASYGNTGWLGMTQVWLSGKHITQAVVKNNSTYFGSSSYRYNNSAEMQHVICQELGHALGLDHQSESGASLNTCMDYYRNRSSTDTKSTHPNQHDYDMLVTVYGHTDSTSTVLSSPSASAGAALTGTAGHWGRLVASTDGGRSQTFVQELGSGRAIVTFVIWTDA